MSFSKRAADVYGTALEWPLLYYKQDFGINIIFKFRIATRTVQRSEKEVA